VLAQRLQERQAPERRCEVEVVALERTVRRRRHGRGDVADHRLDQVHHVVVVGERLVELEHRELRVVRPVDALVAEVLADLVDALEPADDQPLQVQLVGDAQVEPHVERVVMRDERPRRGAAVQRLKHGRLHLDVAALVEEAAQGSRCGSAP
jgi:hypothetical protein